MSENRFAALLPRGNEVVSRVPLGEVDNGNGVTGSHITQRSASSAGNRTARNVVVQQNRGTRQTTNARQLPSSQRRGTDYRRSPIARETPTITLPIIASPTDTSQQDPDWDIFTDPENIVDVLLRPYGGYVPSHLSPMLSGVAGYNEADELPEMPFIAAAPLDTVVLPEYMIQPVHDFKPGAIERAERILAMVPEEIVIGTVRYIFTSLGRAQNLQTLGDLCGAVPPEMLLALAGIVKDHLLRECAERKERHGIRTAGHGQKAQWQVDSCPICLDPMPHCIQATTQCGHIFCLGCLLEWLEESEYGDCPMCRTKLDQVPQHSVNLTQGQDFQLWSGILMVDFFDRAYA